MAKKSDTSAKRPERWRDDVRRWNGGFETGQRSIEALSTAEKYFGLDARKEPDRLWLLYILADVVFGKPGRPRGSKKWDTWKLIELAKDHKDLELQLPKLSNSNAAIEIKKRHPKRYRDTSAEMLRRMLPMAHIEYFPLWLEERREAGLLDPGE